MFSFEWLLVKLEEDTVHLLLVMDNSCLFHPHDGKHVFPKTHVNNLIVHIDRYMLFGVHVSEINKKIMALNMYIRRISDNFDKSSRILLVQTLVLSLMNYCCATVTHSAYNREVPGSIPGRSGKKIGRFF